MRVAPRFGGALFALSYSTVMSKRFAEDFVRGLIAQIDARLREAERLRREADQQHHDRPFWPDRRRTRRGRAPQHSKPPEIG